MVIASQAQKLQDEAGNYFLGFMYLTLRGMKREPLYAAALN